MANPFEIIGQELPKFLKEMNVPFSGGNGSNSVMVNDPRDTERAINELLLGSGALAAATRGVAGTPRAVAGLASLHKLMKVPGVAKYGIPAGITAATGDPTNMLPGAAGLLSSPSEAQALLSKANLSKSEIQQMRDIFRSGGNLQDVFKQMKLARVTPIADNIDDLGKGWERFTSTPITAQGESKLKQAQAMATGYLDNYSRPASEIVSNFPQGNKLEIGAAVKAGKDRLTENSNTNAFYQSPNSSAPGQAMFNALKTRPFDDIKRSIYHELQHHHDFITGRSHGWNPVKSTPEMMEQFNKNLPANAPFTPTNHYEHNIGEARARLNAMLETNPEEYKNLSSIFHNPSDNITRAEPARIWDDMP